VAAQWIVKFMVCTLKNDTVIQILF